MGQILVQMFERILEKEGLGVRMRTAMLANIPSARAMELPDSPENIEAIREALKQIKKMNSVVHLYKGRS